MTIMVRVVSAKAQAQMSALRAQTAGLAAETKAANAMQPLGYRQTPSLVKWGNQLQWTGRQLQYNFALPIALAGAAATKFALDNEKAMVRVRKVYGDTQAASAQFQAQNKSLTEEMANQKATKVFNAELDALGDSFRALSERYGTAQKDVIEIAGAWAAAGQSGRALAESVNTTMQAIILGDLDSAKATEALIAIQGQYNLSSKQLSETLADLNVVENQTGIDMGGLIDGFARAAGVAREAGVDVRHLAAFMAALVPATGSAAQAGNALKTIFSRLMAPTNEASQVMDAMGLNIKSMAWESATGTERLLMMSDAFNKLDGAQKTVVSSVVASRWQINKFSVLMKALAPQVDYYEKALEATSDRGYVFAQMQKELNTVLSSNPQRLKQIWVILQNAMADVIQPMIPYLLYLADAVQGLVTSFSNLNPVIQKFVLIGLLMLAVIGPLMRYIGSITTLVASLGLGFGFLMRHLGIFSKTVTHANGETEKMRGGLIRFLKSFTVTPILFFASGTMKIFTLLSAGISRVMIAILNTVAYYMIATGEVMIGTMNGVFRAIKLGVFAQAFVDTFKWIFMGLLGPLRMIEGAVVGMLGKLLLEIKLFGTASTGMFTGIVARIGAIFSLLPFLIGESMKAVWFVLTVPGAFTGTVYRIWMTFVTKLGLIWTAFNGFLIRTWIVTQRGLAAIMVAGSAMMTKLWAGSLARMAALWQAFLIFMTSPSRLGAVFASIGGSLARFFPLLIRVVTGPIGLIVTAVVGLLYVMRDQIVQIWNNVIAYFQGNANLAAFFDKMVGWIIDAWNKLPQGVQNAMAAVVTVVSTAAQEVYEWLSYLNPFAHHSPSLVENVTKGLGIVRSEFAKLDQVEAHISGAYRAIKAFGQATGQLKVKSLNLEQNQQRTKVAKFAPGALDEWDRLASISKTLQRDLAVVNTRLQTQQSVVDKWQAKVDEANRKLENQQDILDRLNGTLQTYQDKLASAQDRLQSYIDAPLKGETELNNRIAANEIAQKKLRLEMLKMEQVYGTFDEIKQKIDDINGAQELLRGQQTELRNAGAGSEILGQYDKEIDKLDKQKDKYQDAADQLAVMQAALDRLQLQAERMDLVKALRFDRLHDMIRQANTDIHEMTFQEAMRGARQAANDVERYTRQVDSAQAAVDAQQRVVDRMTKGRDRLQKRLDAENATLGRIQNRYDKINTALQAVKSAMDDVTSAADAMDSAMKAKKGAGADGYKTPGLQNFLNAKGANFLDPGGKGLELRKNWKSQVPDIDAFTQDIAKQTSGMFEDINPFKPIIEWWHKTWAWIKNAAANTAKATGELFSAAFAGVSNPFAGWGKGAGSAFDGITGALKTVSKWIGHIVDLLGPEVKSTFKNLGEAVKDMWDELGPVLAEFGPTLKMIPDVIKNLWTIAKPILAALSVLFLFVLKVVWRMVNGAIKPAFKIITAILKGFFRVVNGIFKIIFGLLTLDFKQVLKGFLMIWQGAWDTATGVLTGMIQLIWGLVKGFVTGIVDFFKWLWDVLVGHSIIPDLVEKIVDWFLWLPEQIGKALKGLWKIVRAAFVKVRDAARIVWNYFKDKLGPVFTWLWKKVIQPVFNALRTFIRREIAGWVRIFKTIWTFIHDKLGPVFKWIWEKIIRPVAGWIGDKIRAMWTRVIKPALEAARNFLRNQVGPAFSWLWEHVVQPVWNKIGDAIRNAWNNVIKPMFGHIKDGITNLKDAFRSIKDVVEHAFQGVANVARVPINFVLDDIYNKGLKWLFDHVAGAVGLDWELPTAETIPKFKYGGQVRGGDNHELLAMLHGNEHVWTAAEVRAAGGHRNVAAMRRAALDGPVGGIGSRFGDAWDWTKGKADNAKDWTVRHSLDWAQSRSNDIIDSILSNSEGRIGDLARGGSKDMVHRVLMRAADLTDTSWGQIAIGQALPMGPPGARNIPANGHWSLPTLFPYRGGLGEYPGHNGADWSSPTGGSVYAMFDAYVSAWDRYPGTSSSDAYHGDGTMHSYGQALTIRNPGTGYTALYAHLLGKTVNVGDVVKAGQRIAYSDNKGNSSAPHLHTSIWRNGALMEPADVLRAHGVRLGGGGIVPARRGGTMAWLGEAGGDEAVLPLPNNWRSRGMGGGNTYHFHGDLSFPNVENGDDAEDFLTNLEILARG